MVKNPPANAGTTGPLGSIPELGRSPGEGNFHSSILAWKIPCSQGPDGLQSIGWQKVRHDRATEHPCTHKRSDYYQNNELKLEMAIYNCA